jgi:hypothetical protein
VIVKTVVAEVSPDELALMVMDPAPVAVTVLDAMPKDELTVAGRPETVPVPEYLANVTL